MSFIHIGYYVRTDNNIMLRSEAHTLFDAVEHQVEFMVEHEFVAAHVTMLETQGRWFEAAELRLQQGDTLRAIRLLIEKCDDQTTAHKRAVEIILTDLWRTMSFATIRTDANVEHIGILLEYADQVVVDILSDEKQEVCNANIHP